MDNPQSGLVSGRGGPLGNPGGHFLFVVQGLVLTLPVSALNPLVKK